MMKEIKRKGWANAKSGDAACTGATFSLKSVLTGRVAESGNNRSPKTGFNESYDRKGDVRKRSVLNVREHSEQALTNQNSVKIAFF